MKLVTLLLFAVSALFGAPGDVLAVRVVGSATTVADATSACNTASACDGWVLEVDVDALAVGGAYNLGIGTRNSIANATGYCDVTGEGYDATATLTTITRRLYVTKALRKRYNVAYIAPYPADELVTGATLTLRLALSDSIYAGETVTCAVGAGLYTQASTPTAAFSGSATNNSTLTHDLSRVIANWSWPGWVRINSSLAGDGTNNADGSVTVRAVAYHRGARDGKPVASVLFRISDGTTTRTATATAMTRDLAFGDAEAVTEYVGTFTADQIDDFPNGTVVSLNFSAYPWHGGASGVLDTASTGFSQPSPMPSPRTLLIDHAGTYGTSAAVVDPVEGNDTTCAAVAESAFDPLSPPVACATINRAALVIRTRNNTSHSRGDAAGVIYLAAGSHAWTGSSNTITGVSNVWTVIRPLPGVAREDVRIDSMSGNPHIGNGTKVKLQNVTLDIGSSPTSVFTSTSQYVWLDDCDLTSNATSATFQAASYFVTRSVIRACRTCLQIFGASHPALSRGNTVTAAYANNLSGYTVIGNSITGNATMAFSFSQTGTTATIQPIIAYNRMLNASITSSSVLSFLATSGSAIGGVIVQNVIEYTPVGSTYVVRVAGDGSTVTPVRNIMLWHNTITGGSTARGSNDTGTVPVIRQLWSEVGNIYSAVIIRSDTTTTSNAARVGNWSVLFGVGGYGNMFTQGVGATQFQPEFAGISSDVPRIAKNANFQSTFQPPSWEHGSRSPDFVQFFDRRSSDGLNAGAGGGDYHLMAGSPAARLVPAGMAVLPFDLDGVARKNNGEGAAGAYEIQALDVRGPLTFFVSPGGNNNPGNTCTVAPGCTTITRALSFANKPGDIVTVAPGTYNERPYAYNSGTAQAPISIRGYTNGSCPVEQIADINSRGERPQPDAITSGFIVTANHVTIECFRVVGIAGLHGPSNAGILIGINTTGTIVQDNFIGGVVLEGPGILGRPWSGVDMELPRSGLIEMPTNVMIRRNVVTQTGFGFRLYCGGDCVLDQNETFDLRQDSLSTIYTDGDHNLIFGEGITIRRGYHHSNNREFCPTCHIDCFQTWNLGQRWEFARQVLLEKNTCFNNDQGIMLRDVSTNEAANWITHRDWTVRNNVFAFPELPKTAPTQSAPWCANFEHVDNVLFEHNVCAYTNALELRDGSRGVVRYNIFYLQTTSGLRPYSATNNGVLIDARHNILFSAASTYSQSLAPLDIVNQDPLFRDVANKDFRLTGRSPARNAAAGSILDEDRLGTPRPQERTNDIGAYEFVPAGLRRRIRVIQ
jgi:hypothetical protein